MSDNLKNVTSLSAEKEDELDVPIAELQDREVDELYQMFQEKIKFIENSSDVADEVRENCREMARESLFSEIGRLSEPHRAMERIQWLLENRTQIPVENQVIGSSVELIETHSLHSASSPDHSESLPDIEIINLEETEPKQSSEPEQGLVPLFDITEDGETVFNRETLDSLCAQIGERSVAIISTAGKFRQGKTFWSNVLLDGLRKDKAGYEDYEHIGGRGGIRFQSGYERHTKGIMVWPEVFDKKDKEGKDIAVILIDTQGTFDTCSDIADSAVIFAISLLMSSIKIFNTKSQIDAQDLDALNVFISFSQKTDEKVGQHFILMMRDALETGLQPEYIQYLRSGTRRAPELLRLMDGVFDAFEKVECYMVPRPSDHVLRASGEIRAGDCGSDFLTGLCGAANHVLNNLVAKKVMGTDLTGSTLKQYVENLVEHIRDNHHKAIGSAFAATSQLYFEKARAGAKEVFATLYEQLVRSYNHRPIKPTEYKEAIQQIVEATFKEYQAHPLFGSTELKAKEFESFQRSLLERCHEKEENNRQRYRDVQMADAVNGSYEIYEKEMKPDFLETLLGNKDKKINYVNERHEKAFPMAMDNFENAVIDFQNEPELVDLKRDLLKNMITVRFTDLQNDNAIMVLQVKVREMFTQLREEYEKLLKEQVSIVKKLEEVDGILHKCQELQQGRYELRKAEFLSEASINLPNIDQTMLPQMLDNFKDSVSVEFKKHEDEFEAQVRTHLNMMKLKAKMEEIRSKQQESQRKFNDEKRKTQNELKEMQKKLEQEKRARESADRDRGMHPMILMIKEMNENSTRQFEQMRADREERERREKQLADERAHQRQLEIEMLRQEREERERREVRRAEIEHRRHEEERIRQEATERLRQVEERRRQEAAEKKKEPEKCRIM